jgi:hypothetical protein
MKIFYPYGASDEIFDPHALDFSRKPELGQGFESREPWRRTREILALTSRE